MHSHRGSVFFLLVLLATPAFAAETMRLMGADENWSGSKRLQESVTVPAGIRLTLAAGTRVEFAPGAQILVAGTLHAQGTAEAPVVLLGAGAGNAALLDAGTQGARVLLNHTQLRDAGTGVSLRGTQLSARECTFIGCGTAISLEIRSRGDMERVRFQDNDLGLSVSNGSSCEAKQLRFAENRVGMGISNSSRLRLEGATFDKNEVGYGQQNACDVQLRDCTFQDNQIGASLRQTRRSPAISRSTFRNNTSGITARLFSHVLVEGSTFTDNRTAFDALNFCGAFLR
ncbi:MAG TPA: right-handed parallel beta-helix repeat-containing protein, partial [Deferrisomatales bacterium]|nr:right-handed parallel beta-helix repeat-containing protein [Deferrisomatales bacterium]